MIIIILVFSCGFAMAEDGKEVVFKPVRTNTPPKIDGVLDDAAWQNKALFDGYYIINHPDYGNPRVRCDRMRTGQGGCFALMHRYT